LLSLLFAACTFGWGAWEIMSISIRARFATLESHHAIENASRAKNLIEERSLQLARHAGDWGAWDESYNYVVDLNEEYVKANLTSDGISRLNISCLIFLDAEGIAKSTVGFDFETSEVCPVPESILQNDWTKYSLSTAELNEKHSGVVIVDNIPYLIGSSQILTSEGKGPIRGTILELRKIDDRELASLSKSLRFPFAVSGSTSTLAEQISIAPLDDGALSVRFGLVELGGGNSLECVCNMDRGIMAEGNRALADSRKNVLLMGGLLSLLM
jgi:sensor domain CHASE-containing protein